MLNQGTLKSNGHYLQYFRLKYHVTIVVLCRSSFYDFQMNIVKHFSLYSIKSNFLNERKIELRWFYMSHYIWNISDIYKTCNIRLNIPLRLLTITLREKSPNMEFFLVFIFLYSVRIQENTDKKKLCIWTFFTQCNH